MAPTSSLNCVHPPGSESLSGSNVISLYRLYIYSFKKQKQRLTKQVQAHRPCCVFRIQKISDLFPDPAPGLQQEGREKRLYPAH